MLAMPILVGSIQNTQPTLLRTFRHRRHGAPVRVEGDDAGGAHHPHLNHLAGAERGAHRGAGHAGRGRQSVVAAAAAVAAVVAVGMQSVVAVAAAVVAVGMPSVAVVAAVATAAAIRESTGLALLSASFPRPP